MQLSQAFHGACEAESALKAPSRGQEQQCATFVQAIVFIFPCDWWCVGTLRAVHKTGRLSATFCAVATRTPHSLRPRTSAPAVCVTCSLASVVALGCSRRRRPIRQHRRRKAAVVRAAWAAYLLWEGSSAGHSVLDVVQHALWKPGHNSLPPVRNEADWMGDGCNFSHAI